MLWFRLPRRTVFAGAALFFLIAEILTLQLPLFERQPQLFNTTILLDLSLVAPISLFFLIRLWRPLNQQVLYGLVCAGVFAASLITGTKLWFMVVFVQLGALLIWLTRLRVLANDVAGSRKQGLDWLESLRLSLAAGIQSLLSHPALKLTALDVKVWRYSVFSFVKPKHENALATFSYAQNTTPYLHLALAFLLVLEVIPQHILIHQWSPLAAWGLSIFTLYGLLWLMADYRSLSLKPSELHADVLKLHCGIRATANVALETILSVRAFDPTTDEDAVSLSVKKEPSLTLMLEDDVTLSKLFGVTKSKKLALTLDDDEGFIDAVLRQKSKLELHSDL